MLIYLDSRTDFQNVIIINFFNIVHILIHVFNFTEFRSMMTKIK